MRALAVLLVLAGPAAAQKLDCSAPVTQADMNDCAARDYQAADERLNDIYDLAVEVARGMDEHSEAGVEETLRAAQRAWIGFRDLACELEGLQAEGGSMQPMLISSCLARLTWVRAGDLEYFTEN
jgi:uncharacterized protein YecT (DUF1311 family)